MKGLKSIKEWALRVFALIIKTVAPVWTVKYFTKWQKRDGSSASSKETARLFLPGVKAEVKAIKKLQLTEDQLRRHVWSEGTCEALLKQGNTSLWFLAKTKEAYDLVTATKNAELIADVFANNTPSVEYLKHWLGTAEERVVKAVIGAKPSVFNDLKMSDMRREYQHALLALYNANDKGSYVSKLSVRRAEEVIQRDDLLKNYLTGPGWEEEKELFDCAMGVLLDVDYDFTKSLDSLERYHEDWYEEVRGKAGQSKHLVSYIVERVPCVWFSAKLSTGYGEGIHHLENFEETYRGENWPRVMDARQWLKLAYENLSKPEVIRVCLNNITDLTYGNPCGAIVKMQERLVAKVEGYQLIKLALSKLPEQYAWQLKSKLYASISSYEEAREAGKILPKSYRKGLRAKLVEMTCKSDAEAFIRTYWPFLNWEAENAEAAVRKLAQRKALPFDRLGELSEELKQAALDEIDVVAETECLSSDETSMPTATQKKLLKRRLHPRSEVVLFEQGYHWHDVRLEYISNFHLSEMGFEAMVHYWDGYGGEYERGPVLVRTYAERWGLTESEYLALTRSPYYSDLAAPLKACKPAE